MQDSEFYSFFSVFLYNVYELSVPSQIIPSSPSGQNIILLEISFFSKLLNIRRKHFDYILYEYGILTYQV